MIKTPDRKTAGELSLEASRDRTNYDALEVGDAWTSDVINQLRICIQAHSEHLRFVDLPEFVVALYIATDPLIHNVRRHKYTFFSKDQTKA
jgi:hypothetical protein